MKRFALVFLSVVAAVSEFPLEQECPEKCDCHYFRVNYVTDCSESNLTEIPYEEISRNVYILNMNGNEISELKPFPEEIRVRRLLLADNKLSEISREVFEGLKLIVDIDLSSNRISRVDPDAFRNSHGLIAIDLQNNVLEDVESGEFLKCLPLLNLDISECNITDLNENFFAGVPLLSHLDLSGNPLGALGHSVLRPLTTLSELLLNDCNLTSLDPRTLEHQNHLKLLELSGNGLAAVDWLPIFGRLPRLENLNLRNTRIRNLPEDAFAKNTFLRILVLGDNELTDLDIATTLGQNLKNLNSLDLSNCRLSGPLEEKTFGNATTLRILDLSGNRLSSRDLSVALSPLTKLTTLSLKDCSLSRLPRNTFDNSLQLKELDISWNPLNNVFDDLLNSLRDLEYLNMGYSNLSRLSRGTFSKTTNLKRLILSGNALGELEAGLFENLQQIETLEIENCGLNKPIDENVFHSGTYANLRELKMAGNPLGMEKGVIFPEQLCRLKILDLSNCGISYLPNECFDHTTNLTHLYLNDNNLTSDFVSNSTFLDALPDLEYLDLSGNHLTRLPTNLIRKTSLTDVKLTNNPWVCDCTLAEWRSWALDKGDISHLVGFTVPPEDTTKKGNKRKKALMCRIDSKTTPPLRKQKASPEAADKTWARYLKESHCPWRRTPRRNATSEHRLDLPHPKFLVSKGEHLRGTASYVFAASCASVCSVASIAVCYAVRVRRRRRSRPADAALPPDSSKTTRRECPSHSASDSFAHSDYTCFDVPD